MQETTSSELPKGWQKLDTIANEVIKKCFFCPCPNNHGQTPRTGNLEHLHLFCTAPVLVDTREHCYEKNEQAIYELYNFAAIHEYNTPFESAPQTTKVQECLESTALQTERQARPVIRQSSVVIESREANKAILSRNAVHLAAALNRLPATKVCEYEKYPLAHRLGFITSL
jgi:hypothetical protein